MTQDTKACSVCDVTRPLAEFHRQSASRDGRQSRCKPCAKAADRDYKAANAERITAYNRRWRQDNPDLARACTESWRERNRERYAETKSLWQQRNQHARTELARADRVSNPEKYRAALAAWKADNRERVRDYQRKRRAAGYGGNLGHVDGDAVWAACGAICALCGKVMHRSLPWPDPQSASLDHILPLSKGGAHDQDNVQWAHLVCNLRKGASLP